GRHPQLPRPQGRRHPPARQGPPDDRRPVQHGHPRQDAATVARVGRRWPGGHRPGAPAARAHRCARTRASHRRALLQVAPAAPDPQPPAHVHRGTQQMLVIQRPSVEAIGEEEGNLQRFAISPLEPGFGHTLGNSLRRTLLSSIPGAAITQVRFDDALHEFDTIAGVTEDVTDIILNLKDVVVTSTSDEPVTLRLDVTGPAEVTAGDIITTADVEVLNKDLHIATIGGEGRLAVDLTVERGKGYLSGTGRSTSTIGVIPIDAIFSPVRRVTFSVEPVRVEQSTNYDRLVLEIETDSSLTPRDALPSAGAALRALVELAEQMSDEPAGLPL